jgi:putative PIN family toxin of toxin-antitoxin system
MIRVVLDTNIVVSAALVDEGLPAAIFDLATNKHILMVVSREILAEYEKVLHYPRLKLDPARIAGFLSDIRKVSILVSPSRVLSISRDEADNRFYECADAGKADYLITGNAQHFPVHHKHTKIVSPREFIELTAPDLARGD